MSYIGNEPIVSATRTVTEITATAGQTTFTANGGYTVGYIDVFVNGAQLQSADFTATNGSTVVLTQAAQVGDVVRLVAWGTFNTSSVQGNLAFTGTGNRITGDFSNGTFSNRVAFQTSTTNGNTLVAAIPNGTSTTAGLWVYNNSDLTNAGRFRFTAGASEASLTVDYNGSGTYLPFLISTGGSERLRIDTSGNVGIGTSSPSQRLQATGADGTGFTGIRTQNNNGNVGLAGVEFSSDSTYAKAAIAQLRQNANGNGPLVFYVDSASDAANWSTGDEKMRITSGGSLLVRTTAGSGNLVLNNTDGQNFGFGFNIQKNGNGNPNYELVVGGDNKLYLGYSASTTPAAIGNFATNGTYTATSDIRKKKDISYTFNGLDIVNQLKPVQGRMLDDKESSPLRPMFIAQDMVDVLPSVVSSIEPSPSTDNPLLGIDYSSIIPVLTKAIQELKTIVDNQKIELDNAKAEIELLKGAQ